MRIYILVSQIYPWVGGTETQTETIAKELYKRGHDVTLLTKRFPRSRLPENEKKGFTIKRFTYPGLAGLRYVVIFFKFLIEIIKNRKNIDIFLCMQLTPNGFIGVAAKRILGIPVISYIRGGDWYFSKNEFLERIIISQVLKKSDLVLVQTEKIKREVLREFLDTNIKVIPNGIYPHKSVSKGSDILFVGNLIERKGIEYLISAMKDLKENLIITGRGPLEKKLKMQAKNQKNIRFHDYVPHKKVRDFMAENGKILVLPAVRGEGLPNVILEAMSVGMPVIATNIAGIPDVVRDGKTGILVPPRDVEALRNAILKLSRDKKLREKMSRNCLKEIKKYYWDNIIRQLEGVMSSLVKNS